jgi:hypothetical protein
MLPPLKYQWQMQENTTTAIQNFKAISKENIGNRKTLDCRHIIIPGRNH